MTAHSEKVYTEAELEQKIIEAGFAVEPLQKRIEYLEAIVRCHICCPRPGLCSKHAKKGLD